MSVEMVRAGLEPLPVLPEQEGGGPGRGAVRPAELAAAASGRGADFVLLGRYAVDGREVRISFRFYEAAGGRLLATEEAAGRIDLSLDDAVSSAVEALTPRVETRVAEVARRKAEEQAARLAAEEEARRAAEAEAARIAAARGAEAEGAEKASGPERPGIALGPAAPVPLPAQRPFAAPPGGEGSLRKVELALGFAPFVPVAAPDRYFAVGYAPSFAFLYHLRPGFGRLGVGAHTGVMYVDPEEPDQSAYFRWLIPLGVDLRYSLPEMRPLRLYVQLSGGAAYRFPDSVSEPSGASQRLTRVLPYARGGIGMIAGMGERLGLALDAQYHAYFYLYRDTAGSGEIVAEVISGVLPSASLFLRL
ncbi:MAG: hypothetical protein JW820_17830 [Spirochaetales bacterium]|nr:hypothetical protein [Spirochaetales bacterium]